MVVEVKGVPVIWGEGEVVRMLEGRGRLAKFGDMVIKSKKANRIRGK